jgi:hypothetical protein
VSNYGGCIVEEEIPHNLKDVGGEHMKQEGTDISLNSQELAMIGCLVEEELPPLLSGLLQELR